jgi:hypothetical protein
MTSCNNTEDDGHQQEEEDNITNNETWAEILKLLALGKVDKPLNTGVGPFHTITKLDLYGAELSSLPTSLSRALPNLSILFCMKNKFEVMPAVIGQCLKLEMVSFKSNQVTHIHPEALAPQMRWLILTDNKLQSIPSTIGRCYKLQKLMLSGNQLTCLPEEISSCHAIELIRLSSNQLQEPPMTLLNLPNLSWIALSDNPFLASCASVSELNLKVYPQQDLDDPSKGEVLGRGASGITRKYRLNTDNDTYLDVAVKEYFSTITSDGNPQEERKVSMVASSLGSKSLVKVLGKTKNGNLVMDLLKNYTVFAGPPSMESCSRDVYDINASVSVQRAVGMIESLLFALMKLHAVGICHGDFYGHNILISMDSDDELWLTDFGAAFFYERNTEYGNLIEKIERRAFKHLTTEILSLMKDGDDIEEWREKISQLLPYIEEESLADLYHRWADICQKER